MVTTTWPPGTGNCQLYLNWPNTEGVTFLARRSSGVTRKSVAVALRQSARRHEVQSAGTTLTGHEIVWNLPVALLHPLEPQPGDAVVDGGGLTWAVIGPVQKLGRNSRWKLLCVRER